MRQEIYSCEIQLWQSANTETLFDTFTKNIWSHVRKNSTSLEKFWDFHPQNTNLVKLKTFSYSGIAYNFP